MKLYLLDFICFQACFLEIQNQSNVFLCILLTIIVLAILFFVFKKNDYYEKTNFELVEKNKALQLALKQETNNSLKKFEVLSDLSHKLRTELNAINGITNILIDENATQFQLEYLQSLKKSSQNLLFSLQEIFEINAKVNTEPTLLNVDNEVENVILKSEKISDDHFIDKKILLVEDNKINQMITKKLLEKKQIICQIVENGEDAVTIASQNQFDLILMDVHLPGINGNIATQQIRVFDNKTPIVALTAISLDENKKMLLSYGMNDVITKPFEPKNFYDTILLYIK